MIHVFKCMCYSFFIVIALNNLSEHQDKNTLKSPCPSPLSPMIFTLNRPNVYCVIVHYCTVCMYCTTQHTRKEAQRCVCM